MRKLLFLLPLCAVSIPAWADQVWMGLYMQGAKIGYSYDLTTPSSYNHVPATKNYSATVMTAGLLGQSLTVRIYTTSWTDKHGKPLFMKFDIESAGRSQTVDARFAGSSIRVNINNSGQKTNEVIPVPKYANVVDDAVEEVMDKGAAIGRKSTCYVLDPMTVSLIKTQVTMEGQSTTRVKGKSVNANRIRITDPRETTDCYITAKGDLVKIEAPMGIEMIPVSKEEALAEAPTTEASTDLAFNTSITPDKPIENVASLKQLDLRVTGHDLSALPSDAHQTVTHEGDSWLVSIHPVSFDPNAVSIDEAKKQQPDWIKPSLDIPSDSQQFANLAAKLTAGCKTVPEAAKKIHDYVYGIMRPDAGIGVLRNAAEILKTKEGVCRDYAVLTATLLRAAQVPAKLVSGLVYADGSFYYHAWAEAWDGFHWVGVDSTLSSGKLTAGHIQLAQGDVEQAFSFTFLDKVKVEVLDARRA